MKKNVAFYFTKKIRNKIQDRAIELAVEKGVGIKLVAPQLIKIVADERIQLEEAIPLEGVKKSRISVTMDCEEKGAIAIKAFNAGVSIGDYVAQAILNNDNIINIFKNEY